MQIWDFSSHLNALSESESETSQGASSVLNQAPLIKFGHKDEGYAIDWSPLVTGRLLSGTEINIFIIYIYFSLSWSVVIGTNKDVMVYWLKGTARIIFICGNLHLQHGMSILLHLLDMFPA